MGDNVVVWAIVGVLVAAGAALMMWAEPILQWMVRVVERTAGPRMPESLRLYIGSRKNLLNVRFAGALTMAFALMMVAICLKNLGR